MYNVAVSHGIHIYTPNYNSWVFKILFLSPSNFKGQPPKVPYIQLGLLKNVWKAWWLADWCPTSMHGDHMVSKDTLFNSPILWFVILTNEWKNLQFCKMWQSFNICMYDLHKNGSDSLALLWESATTRSNLKLFPHQFCTKFKLLLQSAKCFFSYATLITYINLILIWNIIWLLRVTIM